MTKPPPPDGFTSWLAYAVATMDTRTLNLESLAGDGPEVSREEFQAAADAELAEVEALKRYPAAIAKLRLEQFTDQRVCDEIERMVREAANAAEGKET